MIGRRKQSYKNPAHYRLDFIKENTLNRVWSIRMTRARVIMVSCAIVAAGAALLWVFFAFTPLRQLLPGALRGDLRSRYVDTALRLDSLENAARANETYLANLMQIMRGEAHKDTSDSTALLAYSDSLLAASEAEREFVAQYESDQRFNLSVLAPLAAEGMVFNSPASAGVTVSENPSRKAIDLSGSAAMPLASIYRGTVVAIVNRPDGLSTIIVQHPNDFISIYDGVDEVFTSRGAKVAAAQRIGHAPASGKASFELWHKGTALNPKEYITLQ